MAIVYSDIDNEAGDNIGGIARVIKYARLADIETLPETVDTDPVTSATADGLGKVTGDIVMKAGKQFQSIYNTLEAGGLNSAGAGELDGQIDEDTLTFFHPGTKAEIIAFNRKSRNDDLIFLVEEIDGTIRLFGNRRYPAKRASSQGGTGSAPSDRKGREFSFVSKGNESPVFLGNITNYGSSGGTLANAQIFA